MSIARCRIDSSAAQRVDVQTVDRFSAFSLRAPEVILKSGFSPAIDIWAIGCIVSQLLNQIALLNDEVPFGTGI